MKIILHYLLPVAMKKAASFLSGLKFFVNGLVLRIGYSGPLTDSIGLVGLSISLDLDFWSVQLDSWILVVLLDNLDFFLVFLWIWIYYLVFLVFWDSGLSFGSGLFFWFF